ncbi:RNA-binding protein 28-like [Paramacrobiotus metropolitanus]|uniref:RNA-binding protein 28-like n=1 Tax=Paramacrobiotus metropolitanus TaxID=2943436 RepID=UPI0024456313|nr:RNA-binding protein 28-like [Paramacrobiotus metropolitanus]
MFSKRMGQFDRSSSRRPPGKITPGRFAKPGFGKRHRRKDGVTNQRDRNRAAHWDGGKDYAQKDYDNAYTSEALPSPIKTEKSSAGFNNDSFQTKQFERKPSKMGRIIVRNLHFSATEDDLRNLMGKCGKITEVKIPTKDDGKARGFAFVQFQSINSAETAIRMFNSFKLKDRPIAVDWAVAKSWFDKAKSEQQANEFVQMSVVEEDGNGEMTDEKSDLIDEKESDQSEHSDAETSGSEKSSSDDESSDKNIHDKKKKKPRKPKKPSDVDEGRTVFVRNLPFDLTDNGLRDVFKHFGRVQLALHCVHKDSGYPRGSGFVQFYKKEHADLCLSEANAGDGVLAGDRKLEICLAETPKARRKAERLRSEKPKKDNRNLYLLKLGKLDDESEESQPMSQNDARKRSALDNKKQDTLKNLNMFVSPTRLSVHNIPKNVSDKQLKRLFTKAANLPFRSIKKCRIMRDMQNLDGEGNGKSRGFGFVEFGAPEDALKALQAVNNNPDIFSNEKRPIVEFSIENKAALLKQEKRLERSKAKLQLLQNSEQDSARNPSQKSRDSVKKPKSLSQRLSQGARHDMTRNILVSHQEKTQKKLVLVKPAVPKPEKLANERVPNEPKKVKRKRKAMDSEDNTDDFSRIVERYKNKLMESAERGGKKRARWFNE